MITSSASKDYGLIRDNQTRGLLRDRKVSLCSKRWNLLWITLIVAFALICFAKDLRLSQLFALTRAMQKKTIVRNSNSASVVLDTSKQNVPQRDVKKVRVWSPDLRSCRGRFVVPSLNSSVDEPPLLMLREAAVDMRHNSVREFKARQNIPMPFRRVVAHISASRGVRPILPIPPILYAETKDPFPTVTITGNVEARKRGWDANIDFIINDPKCQWNRVPVPGSFDKRFKKNGAEWMIIVTITGPQHLKSDDAFQEELEGIFGENIAPSTLLEFELPVILPEKGNVLQTHLSMSFSCVMGLLDRNTLQNLLPLMPPPTDCSEARGSVVVGGGAMFGRKRHPIFGGKEAANYAARSLLGSIRFDTVAIPVLTSHSLAEISGLCKDNDECKNDYFAENEYFLSNLTLSIESELKSLGVPESLWVRIVVFPVCKLGTDYMGHENGTLACDWSVYRGQRMVNDLGYTLFSPFHKWYANFDLDEFAVDEASYLASTSSPHRHTEPQSAVAIFDQRDAERQDDRQRRPGVLNFGWLDFQLSPNLVRNASLEVLTHGGLEFVPHRDQDDKAKAANRTQCMIQGNYVQGRGKAAVSCMNRGFGTQGHDSLWLKDPLDLASRACNTLPFDTNILLYHGHEPRYGNCRWINEKIE